MSSSTSLFIELLNSKKEGRISDALGLMLIEQVKRNTRKRYITPNPLRDDMEANALLHLTERVLNFDIEKLNSDNAFVWINMIIVEALLDTTKRET